MPAASMASAHLQGSIEDTDIDELIQQDTNLSETEFFSDADESAED
jgi:hypothetical protein